ncbi:MAG: HD domain-containing protein [Candidatus Aureabacteria bacterium]|nr:HD domain-containing protein [Candidatus Auribacterota bacterium]
MENEQFIHQILEILKKEISQIKDIDSLLDRILFEARKFTASDAGSLFLVEGTKLKFSYVQNDSLFKDLTFNKHLYSSQEMEIDDKSIAGYVALTGQTLQIEDVYDLGPDEPYSFNSTYDLASSYRTRSMLVVPLRTGENKIVGVIQLINTLQSDQTPGIYSQQHRLMAELFADQAAIAIERAKMTRAIILRMIKMAELRDPKETGAHVNRVGAYSIEIYHQWARTRNIPEKDIKYFLDTLRIAAMLHDVGKVAISDTILKKPGKLTQEEYELMKWHTVAGHELFRDPTSDLDSMAADIALTHHEKWDGTGYPGHIKQDKENPGAASQGKKGERIPLAGRIVALADVYDALISKRCYKDAWPEEKVLSHIQEQSGFHFDPSLVEAFFSIYEVIKAIRDKYADPETG